MVVYLLLVILSVIADQVIKFLIVKFLEPVGTFTLIKGFLEFRYTENSGAAFGMLQNNSVLFAIVTVLVSAAVFFFLIKYKEHNLLSKASCIMIIAGGLGNLIDRLRLHYVIDFIHFSFFDYIFNFADCLVTVGVAMMIVFVLFFMDKKRDREKKDD